MEMGKKMLFGVTFLVLISFLLSACSSGVAGVPKEQQCSVDADCVPAVCCHADAGVNKNYAPDCSGVLCTASCEPGTLDCNQAELACVSGACVLVANE